MGGTCNVTRCNQQNATYWNRYTFGLYCEPCALQINRFSTEGYVVAFKVDHKPVTIEEMNCYHENPRAEKVTGTLYICGEGGKIVAEYPVTDVKLPKTRLNNPDD